MGWPTPQEYNEAIQTPKICFEDEDLQRSLPELNVLGLPKPNSGAFASVYKLSRGERHWAVRCFLRNVNDQQDRYAKISDFILSDDLPYTVDFAYLHQGIRIADRWYPILKMDWVDGLTFESYIRHHLGDKDCLKALLQEFRTLHQDLNKNGIAHGDLQHGNILVTAWGELRLVDYDGMFVPSLDGAFSNELGHPNYQHPGRNGMYFNSHMDRFSCWVIEASLRGIIQDPSLVRTLNAFDDALLFRRNDFLHPIDSPALCLLETHKNEEIRRYSRWLRVYSQGPIEDVPSPPEELTEMPAEAMRNSAMVQQMLSGDGVDWQQLKQFYNTGNVARVSEPAGNLPIQEDRRVNSLAELRQTIAAATPHLLFGNRQLHERYTSYSSTPLWFFLVGTSVVAYMINPALGCMIGLSAFMYLLWTISLYDEYKRAARILLKTEPIDVILLVLRASADTSKLSFAVDRAPKGTGLLNGRRWPVRSSRDFDIRYGVNIKKIRCRAFFDKSTGQPVAIFDDYKGLVWLI